MPESARIVVRRPPGGGRDLLRKYRIEIDGARAGTVRRGGTAEFPVPAGAHRVRATIDTAGSPTLRVDLGPGEVAHLRVQPGGSAVRMDQLVSEAAYLHLSADDGADEDAAPAPRPPLVGLIALPFAFFGIFLVSYGVFGLIHHTRPLGGLAVLAGVALYVVPLALARRARRRRRLEEER